MSISIPGPAIGQILQLLNQGGQQAGQPGPQAKHTPDLNLLKPGSQHTGIITSQAAQGKFTLTLQTGQTLELQQAGKPLPLGTHVTIKITPEGGAQIVTLQLPGESIKADIASTFGTSWPKLTQALNLLRADNPTQTNTFLQALPSLNNLFSGLTNLQQAVQTGQSQALLGQSLTNLLATLGIDFSPDLTALQQLQTPSEPDSWKALLFPYIENEGEDPRQGGFFWRQQEREEEDGTHKDIRFLVQLETHAHGPVQLDGLWHDRTVQLRLRLQRPVEEGFEEGLQAITHQAFQAYGLEGSITLTITPTFPVSPLREVIGKQHVDYNLST